MADARPTSVAGAVAAAAPPSLSQLAVEPGLVRRLVGGRERLDRAILGVARARLDDAVLGPDELRAIERRLDNAVGAILAHWNPERYGDALDVLALHDMIMTALGGDDDAGAEADRLVDGFPGNRRYIDRVLDRDCAYRAAEMRGRGGVNVPEPAVVGEAGAASSSAPAELDAGRDFGVEGGYAPDPVPLPSASRVTRTAAWVDTNGRVLQHATSEPARSA
ncbi:hypothetical protein JCM3770_002425 [Rhodotorula araucariae]